MNDVTAALRRVIEELSTAERLLAEVYSIGVWVKSDDCSDNRRRRRGLRETDWAVSAAHRALTALPRESVRDALSALAQDLQALVAVLEPLPDTIPDTMGDNLDFDVTVSELAKRVTALQERTRQLLTESAMS